MSGGGWHSSQLMVEHLLGAKRNTGEVNRSFLLLRSSPWHAGKLWTFNWLTQDYLSTTDEQSPHGGCGDGGGRGSARAVLTLTSGSRGKAEEGVFHILWRFQGRFLRVTFLFFFFQTLNFLFVLRYSQYNNVVTVSDEQWRDSAIHIHVSILPQTSLLSSWHITLSRVPCAM